MDDLNGRCVAVFARVLELEASAIGEDASPETLEKWDSLAHVQIILALEEEFGISIPPDEGVELESFKMVEEAVKQKLQAG